MLIFSVFLYNVSARFRKSNWLPKCFKSSTLKSPTVNSELTSYDRTKMDTILIKRSLFKQMCQIIEFSADYTVFSLHMSTLKNVRQHLLLKYFEEISKFFLKTVMNTDKRISNLLYSAINLEEKKTRNSGVSMKELQTSRRNFSLPEGQPKSPSQN